MATDARGGRFPGRWRRFLQSLAGELELPRDVVLDVPCATLIGRFQVQVTNHKGVLSYTPTCVRIATRDGVFVVTGSRLRIGSIFRDEVVVAGSIDRIDLSGPEAAGGEGGTGKGPGDLPGGGP